MKKVVSPLGLSLILLALGSPAARAQERAAAPDVPITSATRGAVLDSLVTQIETRYVLPDVAKEAVRVLRRHAARGDYDHLTSAQAYMDTLNRHLWGVAHDPHLHVFYDPAQRLPTTGGPGGPGSVERMKTMMQKTNFGFEKLQRLAGNVGYLDLRIFADPTIGAGDVAVAAMSFLANCDALIIDLRRNTGGYGPMTRLLLTYLTEAGRPLHLLNFATRDAEGSRVKQSWTLPYVPGPRFAGRNVYILTSPYSLSAAEDFAYTAQVERLATLVGETTGGAGNMGPIVALPGGFSVYVASEFVTSPTTGRGWAGVGVKPDVPVPAAEALKEAHVMAVKALLAKASGDEDRARLQRALEAAEKTPPDPVEPPPGFQMLKR
jgi:retinol-binding protein 3